DVGGSWATFASVGSGSYGASVGSGEASLYHVSPASGTRRVFYRLGTGTAADDLSVTDTVGGYDYSGDTGDMYGLGLFFRGSGANAYYLEASSSAVSLSRLTAGVVSSITSSTAVGGSPVFGDQMRMHVQVSGSSPTTIRARAWKVGTTEPSTWAIDTTEGTAANQVAAGAFGIEAQNYSATDNNDWNNGDDVLVTTGTGGGGSDTTAPSVPTGLTATATGPATVALSWTASTDNVAVAGYRVLRGGSVVATVAGTTWTDTGLTASTAYAYTVTAIDGAGNESAASGSTGATTTSATQSTSFAYDAFGNMTTKATNSATATVMAYRDGSHLTSLTIGGVTATLTYDALGRTSARTTTGTGVTETYAYVGTGETVRRVSDGTTVRTSLIDDAGSRLSLTTGSTTRWTLFDHLGSLVGLISADGSLAETYRTDGAGGELRGTTQTGIDAGARNPFRFRGAINLGTDAEPLYEMGARFYAPSAGTWTQMDTDAGSAADPASMNRFLYAESNPTSLIDPTGHRACIDTGSGCDPVPADKVLREKVIRKWQEPATTTMTDSRPPVDVPPPNPAAPPVVVTIPLGPRPSDDLMQDIYNRCLFAGSADLHVGCMRQALGDGWGLLAFQEHYRGEWDEDPFVAGVTNALGLVAFGLMGRLPAALPGSAIPGGSLWANEVGPGHTLARHLGLSDADLLARLAKYPSLAKASSFYNLDIAESAINATLKENTGQISNWLAGTEASTVIRSGTSGAFVGRTAFASSGLVVDVEGVFITLVRTNSLREGYQILRAFPEPLP
ncbi:MAG: RNase A-like domain-containing protein, partial [Candidatus Limnocylindrales bacterium]